VIRASGEKVILDEAVKSALNGGIDEASLDSRTAPGWMVRQLAMQGGGMVQLAEPSADQLIVGALIKN